MTSENATALPVDQRIVAALERIATSLESIDETMASGFNGNPMSISVSELANATGSVGGYDMIRVYDESRD